MSFTQEAYVGFFLAVRDIKRSNPWTTLLIMLVIGLTFFNMLFIGGLLFGIADGLFGAYKLYYSGNILVVPATNKNDIPLANSVVSVAKNMPQFRAVSVRFVDPALLEYNYRNKVRLSDFAESANGQIVGIDPVAEDKTSHLSSVVVAGSYLSPHDADAILVGSTLMQKYATIRNAANTVGSRVLKNADIGSRVRLTVNGVQKEVVIKGVITTNVPTIDSRIYMVDSQLRALTNNTILSASEIAISLQPGASEKLAKDYLIKNLRSNSDIVVQTSDESLPAGIASELQVFTKLEDLIGGIAVIVSSVTIFIVIYVNAVTRRKFIGILKGIGISSVAIEISYVFQALFYAVFGTAIATVIIMGLLVPYYALHPFNIGGIPGTLAITMNDIAPRAIILTVASLISGFIPAWLVTKQNTLDAILGR